MHVEWFIITPHCYKILQFVPRVEERCGTDFCKILYVLFKPE